ncbi:DUF423 domain-containing protein [Algibacter mikhailovii]|uniref:DUF423 domain-containing protein n=1 Tax=Algibacter mikhailovii TaxID=425498 RepID=UPI00249544E4|nr:DUF423 domain-containing protein [Algibacter mikhailovii]
MNRTILITASILGCLSIAFGAFGAHGLKELISVQGLNTFETGVRYQMYHALLLLFVGSTDFIKTRTKRNMYYLIVLGVLFFSGSIYGLATNKLTSFDFKTLGFITPIGGVFLISAWVLMIVDFVKNTFKNRV